VSARGLALCALALGGCAAAGSGIGPRVPALRVTFDRKDGLITNEYALYSGGPGRHVSPVWIATSGSLFAHGGQGWTGRPDSISPDACSCRSTDSAIFRVVTRRHDFGDAAVSFTLTNQRLVATRRTPAQALDGVHVFLRYRSPQELYVVSVNRRDHEVVVKRKLPGGHVNGGHYTPIGSPARWDWKPGVAQHVRVGVRTLGPKRVVLTLDVDGHRLLDAVDDGAALLAPGRVGLRGDNDQFLFDDFTVKAI
jgi:hypothetical protein